MDRPFHFAPATVTGFLPGAMDPPFDIFEWYPRYQNCQRYFLDHAQHSVPVQALSAFLNILLPFQRQPEPILMSHDPKTHRASRLPTTAATETSTLPSPPPPSPPPPPPVSLFPYIRRLVATGMDSPGVLHGFFGDDWVAGVGPLHEQERQNYLFTAKGGGYAAAKKTYDMPHPETIPFLRPLQGPSDAELRVADQRWSEWLAMEDWMLGPRMPEILRNPAM